jgi:hypothetical protein
MSFYLAIHLGRIPEFHAYAQGLREPARAMADSLVSAGSRPRPTVGYLYLGNMGRVTRLLRREVVRALGAELVDGHVGELAWSEGVVKLRGRAIDVLWADSIFYNAYQEERYRRTRWASPIKGDYGTTPALVRRLLADPVLRRNLARGAPVLVTPFPGYLAISKGLLGRSFVEELALSADDRRSLDLHLASTFALDDRRAGALSLDCAAHERGDFVVKPCMYGGAHGVVVGRESDPLGWRRRLEAIWDDPEWVVQEYHPPLKDEDGNYLSLGLYNFNGRLGGVVCRGGTQEVVSVRDSALIPISSPASSPSEK